MEISYQGDTARISAHVDTRQKNWIARIIATDVGEARDFVHGDWESRRGHTNVCRTMLWDIRLAEGDIYQCKGLGDHPDIYRKNSDGYWVVRGGKLEMCDDIPIEVVEARRAYLAHLDTLPPEVYIQQIQGGATAIVVYRSYGVKDALKARGYRYGRYAVRAGQVLRLVDQRPPSGWRLICTTSEEAQAEVVWLHEQGWPFVGLNELPLEAHALAGLAPVTD